MIEEIKFDYTYDLKKANFELDALQTEMLNFYLRADRKFRMAYNKDYTDLFIKFLKDKSRLKEPIPLSCSGSVRGGKSHGMLSVCFLMNYYNGRIIDVRYICPNSMDYLEQLKNMTEEETMNSCFQIDEEKSIWGIGQISKKAKLSDVQNIIAKRNISTISICPNKVANKDAWYLLRAFGRDFTQKVNRYMLYNLQEGEKGGVKPMGMVYIPIIAKLIPEKYSKPLIEAYEKKKDEWVLREQQGEGDVLYQIKRKTAEVFARDEKYLQIKKKDEKLAYIGLSLGSEWTISEIKEILNISNLIINNLTPNK